MKNPFTALFRARDKPRDSVSAAPTFYFGTSGAGKPVNATTAIQLSTVYACVRVISETVASLPLGVYEAKDDGNRKATEHAALMAAVAEDDAGQQAMTETQPEPEQEQPVAGQTTIRVLIKSSGGKVNIRTGNGTSYSRITAVAPGTILEYVASAFNGWQAVKIGSQVGWVSGEYSEITTE